MSRNPVLVRDATLEDVPALLEIWSDTFRRGVDRSPAHPPAREAAAAVGRIASDPDQRLLVAVVEDSVVGAAYLVRAPICPIYAEAAINITHLQVVQAARRRGVGRALIEATVTWAEEKDTGHIMAAAAMHSRDANRFMARLGLAQIATVRVGTVGALRAKVPVEPPVAARVDARNHRSVGTVLAQRRSMRRAQAKSD